MNGPLNVLVHLRESSARYRQRLTSSDTAHYTFCESKRTVQQYVGDADIILGSISFPAQLLPSAGRLRWIQVTGAGVDAFLSKQALPEGVLLTRADVAFGDQIAEYVLGHLLAVTQKLRHVYHLQRSRTWQPLIVEFLKGKTMGIAGTGSIGSAIARGAHGLGMHTLGLASAPRAHPEFEIIYGPQDLGTFLSQLDVLVLALPLTERTRGMIGERELALLKESCILVNVARGAIVDEDALIRALRERRIRSAILDAFQHEPLPTEHPLWTMDNVTLTSHHAGLNIPDDIIDFFLANLERFRSGKALNGLVDAARGY